MKNTMKLALLAGAMMAGMQMQAATDLLMANLGLAGFSGQQLQLEGENIKKGLAYFNYTETMPYEIGRSWTDFAPFILQTSQSGDHNSGSLGGLKEGYFAIVNTTSDADIVLEGNVQFINPSGTKVTIQPGSIAVFKYPAGQWKVTGRMVATKRF